MAIDTPEVLGNQAMTSACQAILAGRGGLARGDRVLDFGCGSGRHVREFAAAGYEVTGVDRPVEQLVAAWGDLSADGRANLHLSDAGGNFPFPSESFDFCYSTSVFEHVMNYDKPISEIARVLKPGAWTLHIFPARWRPVEPHIFTPFGGRFQHPALISLWARLGIRNSFQRRLSAAETAARNVEYSRCGINYPTKREISQAFGRHFREWSSWSVISSWRHGTSAGSPAFWPL